MHRPAEFWQLPGARRFVDGICSCITLGDLLIVEDALDSASVELAISRAIRGAGLYDCIGPEPWHTDLAGAIASATGLSQRSLPVMAAEPRLRGSTLIVGIDTVDEAKAAELKDFAIARNMLARSDQPPLNLTVVARNITATVLPAAWQRHTTQGIVDPLDSLVFASSEASNDPWLLKRLKTAIAVEVGAWDLDLVARLTRLSLEHIVRPDLCPTLWATEFDFHAVPPTWHDQTKAIWGDDEVVHSAWLAKYRPGALSRRVWAGQLSALLPWIDQFRLQVTETFADALKNVVDGEKYRQSSAELDWGPIVFGLRANARLVPLSVVRMSEAMRVVRNELAHGRPASWEQVKAALETSNAFRIDMRSRT